MLTRMIAVTIALLLATAAPARADHGQVDLLLVLAADISRSIDDRKFKLQREGYAAAITDPAVLKVMTGGQHRRIALCFVEWADDYEQVVVVDWAAIETSDDARKFADGIRSAPRRYFGRTSIGAGIDYAVAQFARSIYQAARLVIDVSGDGTSNAERTVTKARDEAIARGITINGLAILSEVPMPGNPRHTHPAGGLAAYYEANVIGGPGSFVVEAKGFDDFGRALISKLTKEIAGPDHAGAVRLAAAEASRLE